MAIEESGFFNAEYDSSTDYWDRVYTAEQFAGYFASLIGNGVFANMLQVKQHSDTATAMDVRVTIGKAFINGYWYNLREEKFFDIDINTSSSVRTDCICLQYNFNDRTIKAVYHKGVSTPVRNGEMYELMLCTISVGSNVTSISQSSIRDTRMLSSVCGYVTGLITQIDFDDAYSQFTTWFNEYKEEIIHEFDDAGDIAQAIFNAWFEHMKGQLSTDAAGNLQIELDNQADMVAEDYSVAKLYDIGAYVTHENKLYRCIRTVTSYGNFNPNFWAEVRVMDQVSALKFSDDIGENCTTVFMPDGSILETYSDRKKQTLFNSDGSITEKLMTLNGDLLATKTTVFNSDDSITETVVKA